MKQLQTGGGDATTGDRCETTQTDTRIDSDEWRARVSTRVSESADHQSWSVGIQLPSLRKPGVSLQWSLDVRWKSIGTTAHLKDRAQMGGDRMQLLMTRRKVTISYDDSPPVCTFANDADCHTHTGSRAEYRRPTRPSSLPLLISISFSCACVILCMSHPTRNENSTSPSTRFDS